MASVDVVIPNYNYGRYLGEAVRSVLSQDVERLRVLVIDNASTDDSAEIAREIARKDPRVEIRVRRRNLGLHASLNEGIEWAESEYFMILCSDDLLLHGALRCAASVMDAHPEVHLVYGSALPHHGENPPAGLSVTAAAPVQVASGTEFLQTICRTGRSPIFGPAAVVRTAAQKEAGPYNVDLPHMCDVEMWMRFALLGSIAKVESDLLIFRSHGENRQNSLRTVHDKNEEMEAVFRAFFAGPGAAHSSAHFLKRRSDRGLALLAYWSLCLHIVRRERGCLDLLNFILRHQPSLLLLPPLGEFFRRPDAWRKLRWAAAQARPAGRDRLLNN
ncbi:glycosyltransferase family A protein [Amaricoccus sp.]|uniref:glycosyltransferase family A protein n=1 Tax=Amaricoccus sp. TaxID=1872485 RepID=UPI002630987C|nr:glycosyltransferase family A protein [Amaricoccus sp.]HRO10714.1 glycosyltransferase family A protein [Amaricoccus sp.]